MAEYTDAAVGWSREGARLVALVEADVAKKTASARKRKTPDDPYKDRIESLGDYMARASANAAGTEEERNAAIADAHHEYKVSLADRREHVMGNMLRETWIQYMETKQRHVQVYTAAAPHICTSACTIKNVVLKLYAVTDTEMHLCAPFCDNLKATSRHRNLVHTSTNWYICCYTAVPHHCGTYCQHLREATSTGEVSCPLTGASRGGALDCDAVGMMDPQEKEAWRANGYNVRAAMPNRRWSTVTPGGSDDKKRRKTGGTNGVNTGADIIRVPTMSPSTRSETATFFTLRQAQHLEAPVKTMQLTNRGASVDITQKLDQLSNPTLPVAYMIIYKLLYEHHYAIAYERLATHRSAIEAALRVQANALKRAVHPAMSLAEIVLLTTRMRLSQTHVDISHLTTRNNQQAQAQCSAYSRKVTMFYMRIMEAGVNVILDIADAVLAIYYMCQVGWSYKNCQIIEKIKNLVNLLPPMETLPNPKMVSDNMTKLKDGIMMAIVVNNVPPENLCMI